MSLKETEILRTKKSIISHILRNGGKLTESFIVLSHSDPELEKLKHLVKDIFPRIQVLISKDPKYRKFVGDDRFKSELTLASGTFTYIYKIVSFEYTEKMDSFVYRLALEKILKEDQKVADIFYNKIMMGTFVATEKELLDYIVGKSFNTFRKEKSTD
jgi:hypothetical protein